MDILSLVLVLCVEECVAARLKNEPDMSSSGSSNSKILCSRFDSSVGPVAVRSGVADLGSVDSLSKSKLGRAATSARASSMRLITGARRASSCILPNGNKPSPTGDSGSDSSCICVTGNLPSFLDRLLLDNLDNIGTDRMSLSPLNFL